MASSLLQKLLRKTPLPPLRILTPLNKSQLASSNSPISPLRHHDPIYKPGLKPPPLDFSNGGVIPPCSFHHHHPCQVYPSFPHVYHLDPIAVPAGASWSEGECGGEMGSVREENSDRTVWADSVKKKRKRKMNKHKYRKLRKRLRRKTKA